MWLNVACLQHAQAVEAQTGVGLTAGSYMNVISLHKELCVVSGWQLEESRW